MKKANFKCSESETRRWFDRIEAVRQEDSRTARADRKPAGRQQESQRSDNESGREDLTRIHGIGAAAANLLRESGINSFRKIYEAGPESLRQLFADAGAKFKLVNPATWSQQAQFAMNGDWDGLTRWQTQNSELVAGSETRDQSKQFDFSTVEPDDLTKIRGIGPASQKILFKNGIFRFEQIAGMTGEQLEEIFEEYRERFQLLNPNAWPKQAKAAIKKRSGNLQIEDSLLNEIESLRLPESQGRGDRQDRQIEAPQIVNQMAGRDE